MTKQTTESIFTFDAIEELVAQFFDESEEKGNAAITYKNGMLTLTTVEFDNAVVGVYQVKESPELYEVMNTAYLDLIDGDMASGSDFWDMWAVLLNVMEPHKIVDETFNP